MKSEEFRRLIEIGDLDGLRAALDACPDLARQPIRWYLNQWNESEPLHYVSDCIFNRRLTNGREGEIATLLLAHGAALDGTVGHESPLIGAVSLGAGKVVRVLVEAGANVECIAVFGARALHWAAWTGNVGIVRLLLTRKPDLEARCAKYGATPLFWAVQGYGPHGPRNKQDQVGAARALLEAGACANTSNRDGVSVRDLARQCAGSDMSELLERRT